jgi:hypothetical protein
LLLGGMRHLFLNVMRRREETPQRPDADADAAHLQLLLKLDERDVRRLGDLAKEERRFGFYTAGLAVAAASTTRRRRSTERDLAMHAGLLRQHAA